MSYPYLGDLLNAIFGTSWTVPIPVFGLFVAAALLVAALTTRKEVRRYESLGTLPQHTATCVFDLTTVGALFGILGARLFHILEHPAQFFADPLAMIFTRGGFSIYGGLLAGTLAGIVFLRRRAIPVTVMMDAAAPAMMLGYGVGRIGCQVSGDGDWGVASDFAAKPGWLPDWTWAQTYDNNIAGVLIPAPGVYPTPMYETAMALLAFLLLWSIRQHPHRAGFLFSAYLLLSGYQRLLIEKIRINPDYQLFGLSFTQAEGISIVLIGLGAAGVLLTLNTKTVLPKTVFALATLTLLSACIAL